MSLGKVQVHDLRISKSNSHKREFPIAKLAPHAVTLKFQGGQFGLLMFYRCGTMSEILMALYPLYNDTSIPQDIHEDTCDILRRGNVKAPIRYSVLSGGPVSL